MKFRLINAMVLSAALSGNVLADLNDGLVAYYPFDGDAKDESGNGNDGTVNGATLIEDRFGNKKSAYSFDGNDDQIDIPYNTINGLSEISTSIWVKTKKNIGTILSGANNSNDNEYLIDYSNTQNLVVSIRRKVVKGNTQIIDGQWHHIALTRSSSDNVNLYVDSKQIFSSGMPNGNLSISEGGFLLGREQDCLGGCFDNSQNFLGSMDDLRIYNRALSESEIQQLYATTLETNISPKDSGTITKSPDKTSYSPNEEVTLTAKPAKGYKFKQWQGDASGSEATITIKMNGNQNVTAVFEKKNEISSKAIYDIKTKTLFLKGVLVPFLDGFSGEDTGDKGIFNVQLQEKIKDAFELIPWSINMKGMFEGEDTSGYINYDHETRSVYIPCFKVATIAEIGDGIEGKAIYYKDVTMKQWNEAYPIYHIKDMTKADSCN